MRLAQRKHSVMLVTNANNNRIESLIKHHRLKNLPNIFFNKSGNKYKHCIESFGLNANAMIVFEDSDKDIKYAKEVGIKNIIKI